jgi:sugar phosphate isomerase/epimerase
VLWGLGTTCEYDSPDPAIVKYNIEQTRLFVELARDVGARGVKVRPNRLHEQDGIAAADTLKQIGVALQECGEVAEKSGVEIWLEVHGQGTGLPKHIETVMRHCGHPSVGVCWNSNPTDVDNGSIKANFKRLKKWIRSVHITELWRADYPWSDLFQLLRGIKYEGFCLAEIPASPEPDRLLHYYRSLWLQLSRD